MSEVKVNRISQNVRICDYTKAIRKKIAPVLCMNVCPEVEEDLIRVVHIVGWMRTQDLCNPITRRMFPKLYLFQMIMLLTQPCGECDEDWYLTNTVGDDVYQEPDYDEDIIFLFALAQTFANKWYPKYKDVDNCLGWTFAHNILECFPDQKTLVAVADRILGEYGTIGIVEDDVLWIKNLLGDFWGEDDINVISRKCDLCN